MAPELLTNYIVESFIIASDYLDRDVLLEAYLPKSIENPSAISLLLINDGQDMETLGLAAMLDTLLEENKITPVLAVGIRCNEERLLEYGTASILDYKLRGSRAKFYQKFVIKELIPHIREKYFLPVLKEIAFAGFSLGGLSALDIAWRNSEIFTKVGAFSASFWWRIKDLCNGYVEETDRIMHHLIREGAYTPGMTFFFSTGAMDETMDRNNNGIIDSIDDTVSLIEELEKKGYRQGKDIRYVELADGRHDIATWSRVMPVFLQWGWGTNNQNG